jgi:predicted phosphodiesterase
MRVAAFYDIHANLHALDAVLKVARRERVDRIVVGGDVLPGPAPAETLDRLLALDIATEFIVGNGDREVLAQMRGIETDWFRAAKEEWRAPVRSCARELDARHADAVASWPATCRIAIDALGDVLFCHATPRSDTEIFTATTPEEDLRPVFDGCGAPIVVCGHTHVQFDRMIGATRVVNAGSVGMPFGETGAFWLLLGSAVELRKTMV